MLREKRPLLNLNADNERNTHTLSTADEIRLYHRAADFDLKMMKYFMILFLTMMVNFPTTSDQNENERPIYEALGIGIPAFFALLIAPLISLLSLRANTVYEKNPQTTDEDLPTLSLSRKSQTTIRRAEDSILATALIFRASYFAFTPGFQLVPQIGRWAIFAITNGIVYKIHSTLDKRTRVGIDNQDTHASPFPKSVFAAKIALHSIERFNRQFCLSSLFFIIINAYQNNNTPTNTINQQLITAAISMGIIIPNATLSLGNKTGLIPMKEGIRPAIADAFRLSEAVLIDTPLFTSLFYLASMDAVAYIKQLITNSSDFNIPNTEAIPMLFFIAALALYGAEYKDKIVKLTHQNLNLSLDLTTPGFKRDTLTLVFLKTIAKHAQWAMMAFGPNAFYPTVIATSFDMLIQLTHREWPESRLLQIAQSGTRQLANSASIASIMMFALGIKGEAVYFTLPTLSVAYLAAHKYGQKYSRPKSSLAVRMTTSTALAVTATLALQKTIAMLAMNTDNSNVPVTIISYIAPSILCAGLWINDGIRQIKRYDNPEQESNRPISMAFTATHAGSTTTQHTTIQDGISITALAMLGWNTCLMQLAQVANSGETLTTGQAYFQLGLLAVTSTPVLYHTCTQKIPGFNEAVSSVWSKTKDLCSSAISFCTPSQSQ